MTAHSRFTACAVNSAVSLATRIRPGLTLTDLFEFIEWKCAPLHERQYLLPDLSDQFTDLQILAGVLQCIAASG